MLTPGEVPPSPSQHDRPPPQPLHPARSSPGLLAASLAGRSSRRRRASGLDLKGGVELVYQGKPTPPVARSRRRRSNRAIDIMRKRVDQLGVAEPEIQRSGSDQIPVGLPDVKNAAARAASRSARPRSCYFYDWEPNVIGAGRQAGARRTRRSPADPGRPTARAAISHYDAVSRASKRPAIATTAPRRRNRQLVLPASTRRTRRSSPARRTSRDATCFAERDDRPAAARRAEVVTGQPPGTVIVQAEQADRAPKVTPAPLLRAQRRPGADRHGHQGPAAELRQRRGRHRRSRSSRSTSPTRAASVRSDVTRTIAQRGQAAQLPGQRRREQPLQHFAIVLDNQLISRPVHRLPRRTRTASTAATARRSRAASRSSPPRTSPNLLKTGALPIKLELISQSQVSATLGKQALHQGLIAGARRLRARRALPARLLPRARRDRGRALWRSTRIYFFALIKLIPITLTLPGIAGLILTIGVAADANIVIFERVKEEIRARQIDPGGDRHGLQEGPRGDHRRERRHVHDRVHPVRARDRRASRASRSRSASARSCRCSRRCSPRRRSLGTMGRSRLSAHAPRARRRRASAPLDASTSWARRSGSSRCPA